MEALDNSYADFFLFAWLIAIFFTLSTFLMPLRAAFAYVRSPWSKERLYEFREKQNRNTARKFRYLVGIYVFPISLLSFLMTAFAKTAFPQTGEPISALFILVLAVSLLGMMAVLLLVPVSFLIEFYLIDEKRHVRSFAYALLLLYSLSFPVSAYLILYPFVGVIAPMQTLSESFRAVPRAERYRLLYALPLLDIAPVGELPFRLTHEDNPCNRTLDALHLRISPRNTMVWAYDTLHGVNPDDARSAILVLLVDQYLRGITLGANEFYGCTFSDITQNTDNIFFCTILWFYRWCVSAFAIGILVLPFKRLLDRIKSKLQAAEND